MAHVCACSVAGTRPRAFQRQARLQHLGVARLRVDRLGPAETQRDADHRPMGSACLGARPACGP